MWGIDQLIPVVVFGVTIFALIEFLGWSLAAFVRSAFTFKNPFRGGGGTLRRSSIGGGWAGPKTPDIGSWPDSGWTGGMGGDLYD